MYDNFHYLRLCGRLMNGKHIDEDMVDRVASDNMLYNAFGMSSEDILENFMTGRETAV